MFSSVNESDRVKIVDTARQISEDNFQMLLETLPGAFFQINGCGRFTAANSNATLLTGYSHQELLGLNLKELFPEEIAINQSSNHTNFESENTFRSQLIIIKKDGDQVPVEIISTKLPDGKFHSLVRKISVEAPDRIGISQLDERNHDSLDRLPDGIYKRTSGGKLLEVNSAMVSMLGFRTKEELLAGRISFSDMDELVGQAGTGSTKFKELQFKKRDGSEIWLELHEKNVCDYNGNVLHRDGVIRDISERKLAEIRLHNFLEELKVANSAKDKFFSIISHDLKNLFHSLNSALDLIRSQDESLTDDEKDQMLESAQFTSAKAYTLLENLLNWSRSQMNTIEFMPEMIDISEIVFQNVELLKSNALLKKISIVNRIYKNTTVFADRNMFATLIRNLISNAIKFTSEGGLIEIDSRIVKYTLEITIKDNGIGIEPKNINKLFRIDESFSKLGTKNETGTGLGLILCKEFVERNNGKIWIESEFGRWTKVKFTLPLFQ